MAPVSSDASHDEGDNGADHEQADDGHATVDLSPPDCAGEDVVLFGNRLARWVASHLQFRCAVVAFSIFRLNWLKGHACGKHPRCDS